MVPKMDRFVDISAIHGTKSSRTTSFGCRACQYDGVGLFCFLQEGVSGVNYCHEHVFDVLVCDDRQRLALVVQFSARARLKSHLADT
jgi:hypothetical protein